MLSKLSGLFSSLQGTIAPGMLGVGGFPGQPAAPDQAAGSALPTQDPNASALAGAGQGDGPEAGPNPNWRPFSDMMQVIEAQCHMLCGRELVWNHRPFQNMHVKQGNRVCLQPKGKVLFALAHGKHALSIFEDVCSMAQWALGAIQVLASAQQCSTGP